MKKEEILAGLDLGSSTIKCVVGVQHQDGTMDVIGTGTHPATGLEGGTVYNRTELVRSIGKAIDEAEMMAGCDIKVVYVGIGGTHIQSFNSNGMVRIRNGQVAPADVAGVIDISTAVRIPAEKEVLHVIPQTYLIDGQSRVTRPLGMNGVRLEVNAHIVTAARSTTDELEACCKQTGLKVAGTVFSPLAAAQTLLSECAREVGVVLVDIGGETTNLAVFQGGAIVHSAVLGIGGSHVSADIHDCLHIATVEAERIKQTQGCALASLVEEDEQIDLPGAGGLRSRPISRSLLCDIIEARVEEILLMVREELQQEGFVDGLPGGVVLTGGTVNMDGSPELATKVLGMPAAVATPKDVEGLIDVVRNPRYATGTGLLLCAARREQNDWFSPRKDRRRRRKFLGIF